MLSGKSQRCQWRVELHCELLPWLLGMPLGLSRKRAKDLLRFRAVHVERTSRKREGTAGHAGDVAAPRSSVSRDAVRHDTMLEPGDVVAIDFGKQANQFVAGRRGAKASGLGLKIVFFDDAIVVIDKPAGLLSMGSDREKEKTAHRILNDYLKEETKSS